MSTESDLQADLDALATAVNNFVTNQAAAIAALQAQIAAGSPVTPDQLNALDAEVKKITASIP